MSHIINTNISQQGLIVAPNDFHALIKEHCAAAYRVKSFDDVHAPRAQDSLTATRLAYLRSGTREAYREERIFDAAHGRRYMLFVYCNLAERKACFDYICRAQ